MVSLQFFWKISQIAQMCYSFANVLSMSVWHKGLEHKTWTSLATWSDTNAAGDPISEVSGSQRWLVLFYKTQLSPPPSAKDRSHARRESTLHLPRNRCLIPTLLLQGWIFLQWHFRRKTARRTHESAQCATSVCRAPRGPWAADMSSATTVWSKRWSASTAMGTSKTLLFAPSADISHSSRNKRKRSWPWWRTSIQVKCRPSRYLSLRHRDRTRAQGVPPGTLYRDKWTGLLAALEGCRIDSPHRGGSAPAITRLRSSS